MPRMSDLVFTNNPLNSCLFEVISPEPPVINVVSFIAFVLTSPALASISVGAVWTPTMETIKKVLETVWKRSVFALGRQLPKFANGSAGLSCVAMH